MPPNLAETMWEQIVAKGTIDVLWIKEQLDLLARAETAEPAVENPEIVPANPVTPKFCPVAPKACPCTPQRAGSSLSPLAYVSPQRKGHVKARASELWYRTSPTRKKRIATAAVALKAEPKYSARKLDSIRNHWPTQIFASWMLGPSDSTWAKLCAARARSLAGRMPRACGVAL